jgi:hypothetical protein
MMNAHPDNSERHMFLTRHIKICSARASTLNMKTGSMVTVILSQEIVQEMPKDSYSFTD